MSENNVSNFEAARAAFLNDKDVNGIPVTYMGARYLVMPPSMEDLRLADDWSIYQRKEKDIQGKDVMVTRQDPYAKTAALLILTTFDPDSGRRLFTKHDLATALKKRDHGVYKALTAAVEKLNTVGSVEEAAGNSEPSPSASLSIA